MSTIATAVTSIYRKKVAQAAAHGTAIPRMAYLAFGTGDRPYDLDDVEMHAGFLTVPAHVTVAGVQVTAAAAITGLQTGSRTVREVGVFAEDHTLIGRRVIAPKKLEPETQIEFELTFQY